MFDGDEKAIQALRNVIIGGPNLVLSFYVCLGHFPFPLSVTLAYSIGAYSAF